MKIAVDAMGGDFAPAEIVAGAVEAARKLSGITKIYLVGEEGAVKAELAKYKNLPDSIEVRHASQVVDMAESPATAIRRKKDSSIVRSIEMVKAGEADAVFSAGNTGAAVAGAQLKLRTLKGVDRPAIATILPTPTREFVLLDSGANTDSTPEMLQQFAVMGSIYCREILGRENPKVGMLSIGEEAAKGNDMTKKAYKLLDESHVNFIGNIESRDMFEGRVDVVTCDGFVGNVVLKTTESVARMFSSWLKIELKQNLLRIIGYLLARGGFQDLKRRTDPEAYGGASLLGANGVVIIGHGSSSARAVFNGIRYSAEAVSHDLNHLIEDELAKLAVEQ